MSKKWWFKFGLLVLITGISGLIVLPTFVRSGSEKLPFSRKINLGLDLQGGLYLVMGVDFNKVFREIADRQGLSLAESLREKGLGAYQVTIRTEGVAKDDPRIRLNAGSKKTEILELLSKDFPNFRVTDQSGDLLELGLSNDYRNDIREKTVGQSMEVIRNRIDEFGVAEPQISSQGVS